MATKTAEPIINAAYTQTVDEGGPSFPYLMASDYQPKINDEVFIGLPESAWDMLAEGAKAALSAKMSQSTFGDETVDFYIVGPSVRWVILGLPKLFVVDSDNNVEPLTKGMKLAGSGKKTIAKLFLCAVAGDSLVLDANDDPLVFTLNLKSTKTSLIGRATDKEGSGTIWALNNALRAHWKGGKGSWFTSQVSVDLGVKTEKFTSTSNGSSSVGVMFVLNPGARVLPEADQAKIYQFLQSPHLREAIADPFRISASDEPTLEEVTISDENGDPIDGIPF